MNFIRKVQWNRVVAVSVILLTFLFIFNSRLLRETTHDYSAQRPPAIRSTTRQPVEAQPGTAPAEGDRPGQEVQRSSTGRPLARCCQSWPPRSDDTTHHRSALTMTHEPQQSGGIESSICQAGHPCSYNDTVDLRIIVITYKRPASLAKLLQSLVDLELDNRTASVEIWIDRNAKTGAVDEQTVQVASEFRWHGGPTRVHVHRQHVGIYGQWIDTWRPRDDSDDELALFLEDDISVSKYAYRWVRAVFQAYGNRSDFAGVSLTSNQMRILSNRPKGPLAGPKNHQVMMYKCFGTWGFAPKPYHWRRFQDWYHTHKPSVIPQFHPYVPEALPTYWYKSFERTGRASHMWSMWYIYYMHTNQLYSIYSNLRLYNGDRRSSLATNRFEVGLHFPHKGPENLGELLTTWKEEFVKFPDNPVRLNWDGTHVPEGQRF